jgi:hypothetical protein
MALVTMQHSTQEHELALHNHYSTALMALSHQQGQDALSESTQLGTRLLRLGELLRKVMRLEGGELPDGSGGCVVLVLLVFPSVLLLLN